MKSILERGIWPKAYRVITTFNLVVCSSGYNLFFSRSVGDRRNSEEEFLLTQSCLSQAGVHASGAISTRLRKVMRDPIRNTESIIGFQKDRLEKSWGPVLRGCSRRANCHMRPPRPYMCGYGLRLLRVARWMTRRPSACPVFFIFYFPPRIWLGSVRPIRLMALCVSRQIMMES